MVTFDALRWDASKNHIFTVFFSNMLSSSLFRWAVSHSKSGLKYIIVSSAHPGVSWWCHHCIFISAWPLLAYNEATWIISLQAKADNYEIELNSPTSYHPNTQCISIQPQSDCHTWLSLRSDLQSLFCIIMSVSKPCFRLLPHKVCFLVA